MLLFADITDEVKRLRAKLDEVWHAVGQGQVGFRVRESRFLLGLFLEANNMPHDPYRKAHNLRAIHNENYRVPEADVYDGNTWWIKEDAIRTGEICRKALNDIAKKLGELIYLAAPLVRDSDTLEYLLRAKQDTELARCWLSHRMTISAEPMPEDVEQD